ncbi:MAG: DEAD/DEAH box helicase [archaeon]
MAIISNLISRGLPTRLPFDIEKQITSISKRFKLQNCLGSEKYTLSEKDNDFLEKCFRALHIIDPNLKSERMQIEYQKSWEKLDSQYEEGFLYNKVSKYFGEYFTQLVEPQRFLTSIIQPTKTPQNLTNNFHEQRVDFSIEFPHQINGRKGQIIEIDGEHHHDEEQHNLDVQRDNIVFESTWRKTLRIKTSEWDSIQLKLAEMKDLLDSNYFSTLRKNYDLPLYDDKIGFEALQLILCPIAIARIEKSLAEFFLRTALQTEDQKEWKVAIVEHDISGGVLAVGDFYRLLDYLYLLQDKGNPIPQIQLTIYQCDEYYHEKLNSAGKTVYKSISDISHENATFDLVIDSSVLQRKGLARKSLFPNPPDHYIVLRSCHSIKEERKFYTTQSICYEKVAVKYEEQDKIIDETRKEILQELLQDVFRKKEFFKGQLSILSRALQRKSVIGLLPTGGGKSLTYQLATLLQPGVTLIVDPLKSLMVDQNNGLKREFIDCGLFINSLMNSIEIEEAENQVVDGKIIFVFVSPERLLIEKFQKKLVKMAENKMYFNYAVIDEVHCVSEWGHDFRPSYLLLGRNAIEFCKTSDKKPIPLFGLTATASYDVLSDVLRVLSVPNEDGVLEENHLTEEAIIRFETYNRHELQYKIVPIKYTDMEKSTLENQFYNNAYWNTRKFLGNRCQTTINDLLKNISNELAGFSDFSTTIIDNITERDKLTEEQKKAIFESIWIPELKSQDYIFFDESRSNAGIIFTPHRTGYFGVTDRYHNENGNGRGVSDNLLNNLEYLNAGTFLGASDEQSNQIRDRIEEDNQNNQDAFINDRLNLMVCTKAFGMGIDKPNIRFTIHQTYSSSIEGLVQEAGRSGRDRKLAVSFIIYNDETIDTNDDKKINVLEDIQFYLHNNSFKGIGKEKRTLYELLTEIDTPEIRQYSLMAQEFKEKINIPVYLGNPWPHDNPQRIYVNDRITGLPVGYFDLIHGEPHITDHNFSIENFETIIQFIRDYLNHHCPNGNIGIWLNQLIQMDTLGVQAKIDTIELGDKFEIVVPYNNDHSNIYLGINSICHQIDPHHQNGLFSHDDKLEKTNWDEFLEKIEKKLNLVKIPDDQGGRLKTQWEKFRTRLDTEKAIYRLCLIGVLDGYRVNYNAKTFAIFGVKKQESEYRRHLENYLIRFYSEIRVQEIIEGLENRPGENYIQKMLNFLIEFVYIEIELKRREGIKAVKELCVVGLLDGNKGIKEFIDVYFNSKYAKKGNEAVDNAGNRAHASLFDETDQGINEKIEIVWRFIGLIEIDKTGAPMDNLNHLRGATIRFLISNPSNFTLLLLRAFSVFILERNRISESRLIEGAKDDYIRGFSKYLTTSKVNFDEFQGAILEFSKCVDKYMIEELTAMIKNLNETLFFRFHFEWLKQFNEKFLEGYGNTIT